MKSNKEKIIETINNFINDELIVDSNEFIYINVFVEELQNYCNKNNLFFDKNYFKCKTCFCLGLKLGIKYKSSFNKGFRIYSSFKFKRTEIVNIVNKNSNISNVSIDNLQTQIDSLTIKYTDLFNLYSDLLIKIENKSKPVEKVKLSSFIVDSLNLSQEKDSTYYTLSNFCLDFIEYSEDTKNILYSNIIIGDYKKYTNSMISDNTLSKMLKKSLMEIYPDIESKSYNDKNYYKGFIYKNVNIK